MKKVLLLAILCAFVGTYALTAQSNDAQKRTIRVNAEAETLKLPDTFEISISFGESKEFFGKQNIEKLEDQIIQILKKNNIDVKKDVKTVTSSNYVDDKTVFIRKTISMPVESYAAFYKMSKELDFKGITRVWLSKKYYSKYNELCNQLLSVARENAEKRAISILEGSDCKLGKITSIYNDNTRSNGYGESDMVAVRYTSVRKSSTEREEIEDIQEIKFYASLTVEFEIIDK